MKYLLILLILFSTCSFSKDNEIVGKGLTCIKIQETNLKKYSAYYFKKNKKVKTYGLKKIKNELKIKYLDDLKYTIDGNFITIYTNYSFYKINRKTLEVVPGKSNKCKLHNSLLKVFMQMKIYVDLEKEKL